MLYYFRLNNTNKMGLTTPKKLLPTKRNRSKSIHTSEPSATINEDENSCTELPDYGNGIEMIENSNENITDESDWNSDDDRELVENIKKLTNKKDKLSFKARLERIKWNEVAFKNHTPVDCQERFKQHLKYVRRHRNLNEIVIDVEANIKKCPLKRPLNSYQIFIQEQLANVKSCGDFAETMRNMATMYKELLPDERAVYESKANQLREEYLRRKKEFMLENPKTAVLYKFFSGTPKSSQKLRTPFTLFADYNKLMGKDWDHTKMRDAYANLSLDEKYEWVNKAVNLAPNEDKTKFLNKEEQRIFKGQIKATPTAYSLFVKEMHPKLKNKFDSTKLFREIAQRWKSLNEKQKIKYSDEAQRLKKKATKEQTAFNERHGVSEKKKRKQKSIATESTTTTSRIDVDLEQTVETPKKGKKRKHISTSASDDETSEKSIKLEEFSPILPVHSFPSPIKTPSRPMTVIYSPLNDMEKKKNKHQSKSIEESKTKERLESDAVSSASSSSKKKPKKDKKSKEVQPPGKKPPSTLFKYFATEIYTGKPHKAAKSFKKLTKKETKQLSVEYNEKVESYVANLKAYLASLSKEESIKYISKVKAEQEAEADNDDDDDGDNTESQDY